MKILITGCAGFIGSWLCEELLKRGHQVFGIDDLSGGFKENIPKKVTFAQVDLRNEGQTNNFMDKVTPDFLCHLAADASEGRSFFTPVNCLSRDVMGSVNVITSAIRHNVSKILFTSSMAVYGRQKPPFEETMDRKPEDVYAIGKSATEEYLEIQSKIFGFEYMIVRPHNVYGERQNLWDPYRNVLGIWIRQLLEGKGIYIYGDGKQRRAFSYIEDTIRTIADIVEGNKWNDIVNIGGIKEYELNDVANLLLELFGKITLLGKFDGYIKHLPDRVNEVKNAYSTYYKSVKKYGYREETSFKDGLKEMIEWAKKVYKNHELKYMDMELSHDQIPKVWIERKM